MRKSAVALACCALAAAVPAHAVVVFSDGFTGENAANGGTSVLNYGSAGGTSFANFTVTGNVDLIRSGDFGISCVGASGLCVDLDGSNGPGRLTSRATFGFGAGDTVRLSFAISGNQRGGAADDYNARFDFGGNVALANYGRNLFGTDQNQGAAVLGGFGFGSSVFAADPFATRSIYFTAAQSGTLTFSIFTASGDSAGPILDTVALDISPAVGAIPEPATWAMMIGGFGVAGGALRRRARRAIAAA